MSGLADAPCSGRGVQGAEDDEVLKGLTRRGGADGCGGVVAENGAVGASGSERSHGHDSSFSEDQEASMQPLRGKRFRCEALRARTVDPSLVTINKSTSARESTGAVKPKPTATRIYRFSLVDLRWAAAKGFYDLQGQRWIEEKGGMLAYLEQRKRARKKSVQCPLRRDVLTSQRPRYHRRGFALPRQLSQRDHPLRRSFSDSPPSSKAAVSESGCRETPNPSIGPLAPPPKWPHPTSFAIPLSPCPKGCHRSLLHNLRGAAP